MDDYISRQTAIKTALTFFVEYLGGAFHEDMQAKLKRRFEETLSTDAQPEVCEYYALCRHGRDENKLRERLGVCEYCNEDAEARIMDALKDGEQNG